VTRKLVGVPLGASPFVPPAEVSHKHPSGGRQQTQFVVATHTINRNDLNALGAIALEAKQNLK
jgi:hypothetical protein